MTTPQFPTLSKGQDSKYFNVELEDPAMRSKMEGGYVVSRARHTRRPRKTFTTGFTSITGADYKLLDDFYTLTRGGSVIFTWINPTDDQPVQVRFKDAFKLKYTGIGHTRLWDVTFQLEEA